MTDKASHRNRLDLERSRLSLDEARARSLRVEQNLIADPRFQQARTIGLYRSMGREVATAALHRAALEQGKRLAYPEVLGAEEPMRFIQVDDATAWRRSSFGFEIPEGETLTLEELELIVLPGLGFDRAGRRLGRGKGHYDRTLGLAPRALRIGLAFDFQVVDALPEDPWDLRMHAVACEGGMFEALGASRG